jgi:hypothetical protein
MKFDIKMHFKETDGKCKLDLSGLEYGPVTSSSKQSNEMLGCIKYG